jgi:hypothetical protein
MAKTKGLNIVGLMINHLSTVIGTIVSIAGLVSLLTSHWLKAWLSQHSYLVFVLLFLSITIAFVVIDFTFNRRRTESNQHDRETVAHVLRELSPHSQIIIWLKESFISKSVPAKFANALEEILSRMRLDVVGLDNRQANRSYRELQDSLAKFLNLTEFNLFPNLDFTAYVSSPDWPREQWGEASKEINTAEQELVRSYDNFVRVCHRHHLD